MKEVAIGYWRQVSERDSTDPTLLPWPEENTADDPQLQHDVVDALRGYTHYLIDHNVKADRQILDLLKHHA